MGHLKNCVNGKCEVKLKFWKDGSWVQATKSGLSLQFKWKPVLGQRSTWKKNWTCDVITWYWSEDTIFWQVSNMKYESCKPRLLATVKLLAGMWLPCCPTPSCHVYAPRALPLPMITEKSNSWVLKSVVLCLIALWASWALLLILFLWDCLESTRQKQQTHF